MYYHRRPPVRRTSQYFMPFFMIVFLGAVILFGWRAIGGYLNEGGRNTENQRVFLTIENGSVKAMAADSDEWKGVPDKIYLYRGEKVRTGAGSRASLGFWNGAELRMDKESEVDLKTLWRKKDEDRIEVELPQGSYWVKMAEKEAEESRFTLHTDWLDIESKKGVFAVETPGTVAMMEGSAQVSVRNEDEIIKTFTLGVGQQFVLDTSGLEKLATNQDVDVIFAISDVFRRSDWYQWNALKDGETIVPVAAEEAVKTETPVQPKEETVTETDKTEEPAVAAVTETETPVDPDDKTPPPAPQILKPAKNGETFTLTDIVSDIEGTVSADTAEVIVDDYSLQLYEPGSGTFRYSAKTAYGNLKVGENTFKIFAKDRNGNRSEPAVITLTLSQEVIDAHPVEETTAAPVEKASGGNGGVKITAPNNGESFKTSETQFDIAGVVPANTVKVLVNDYKLSKFEAGQTAWTYKAYKSLGSLEIGRKNTYTVEAYDADEKLLGTASITIDVESEGAPIFTIPTSRSSYQTTLDELVIGGVVGKWVQIMYVNDQKLLNYIPGSEKWSHTVVLKPGVNTFRVYGKTSTGNTDSSLLTITFKP